MGRLKFRVVLAAAVTIAAVLCFVCLGQAQQSGWWGSLVLWVIPAVGLAFVAISLLLVEVATFLPDPLPSEELQRNPTRRGLLTSNEVRITSSSTSYLLFKRYHLLKGDWHRIDLTPNFCQFFWSITIGLPLAWLLKAKLVKGVAPIKCVLVLGAAATLAALLYFWPGRVVIFAILTAVFWGSLSLLYYASRWLVRSVRRAWKRWRREALYLLAPLWVLPVTLIVGIVFLLLGMAEFIKEDLIDSHAKSWGHWFFGTRPGIFRPWQVYVLPIVVIEWWHFGSGVQLEIAKSLLIVSLSFMLGAIIVILLALAKDALFSATRTVVPAGQVRSAVDRGTSMWQLFWLRLKAEKRKVCPLIVLPDE